MVNEHSFGVLNKHNNNKTPAYLGGLRPDPPFWRSAHQVGIAWQVGGTWQVGRTWQVGGTWQVGPAQKFQKIDLFKSRKEYFCEKPKNRAN